MKVIYFYTFVVLKFINFVLIFDFFVAMEKNIKNYFSRKIVKKLDEIHRDVLDRAAIEKANKPLEKQKNIITFHEFSNLYVYRNAYPSSDLQEFKNFNEDLKSNRREILHNFVRISVNEKFYLLKYLSIIDLFYLLTSEKICFCHNDS